MLVLAKKIIVAVTVCLLLSGNGAAGQKQSSREAIRRNVARLKAMPPVRGLVFHCCSCAVPCPCMFIDKDVEGCNIVRIFHVTNGGYVGKHLVGLTAVYVPHPADLKNKEGSLRQEGKVVDAALYVPTGLTKRQEDDLMGLLVENDMTIGWNTIQRRRVPLVFRKQAGGYEVEIAKVFHAKMQSVQGANGKPIIAENLPMNEGSRWHIGRSIVHEYQNSEEKEWHWTLPKTNGSWTFFAWGPHIDPSDEYEANQK